jgi:transposase
LFFGSDRGGRTLATLASFTATCQQFGVEPWTWLKDTLTRLPVTAPNQLATLLPAQSS